MSEKDLPFEIVWLDDVGGEPAFVGVTRIERYNLDQAITHASHELIHQKGLAAGARGFLVHAERAGGPGPGVRWPIGEPAREALANIRQALPIIARTWESMSKFGHSEADDMAGAQADLEQAVRFLTGEEQPS